MTSVMSKVESNHTRISQANTKKSELLPYCFERDP